LVGVGGAAKRPGCCTRAALVFLCVLRVCSGASAFGRAALRRDAQARVLGLDAEADDDGL